MIRSIPRSALLLLALCTVASPARAAEEENLRLQRLNIMFENFETGFAYLRHCGDFDKALKEKPFYLTNAQITATALREAIVAQNPTETRKSVEDSIIGRRTIIQKTLDVFYDRNGCMSPQAAAAKKIYDQLSDMPPSQTQDFIRTIETQ